MSIIETFNSSESINSSEINTYEVKLIVLKNGEKFIAEFETYAKSIMEFINTVPKIHQMNPEISDHELIEIQINKID